MTLQSDREYKNVWFPIWSDAEGQDDIRMYKATLENGVWKCEVNLSNHDSLGAYLIHAYSGEEKLEELVANTVAYVAEYPPCHIETEMSTDNSTITFNISNVDEYTDIRVPIWSKENDQDDLVWYDAEQNEDGTWTCIISTENHLPEFSGILMLHVYGKNGSEESQEFLRDYTLEL